MTAKEQITGALIRSARNAGLSDKGVTVLAISVIDKENGKNVIAYAQGETDSWSGGVTRIIPAFDQSRHEFIIAMRSYAGKNGDHHKVADRLQEFIAKWLMTIDLHQLAENK